MVGTEKNLIVNLGPGGDGKSALEVRPATGESGRVRLIATFRSGKDALANKLIPELHAELCREIRSADVEEFCQDGMPDMLDDFIYLPSLHGSDGMLPDLAEAERVFHQIARCGPAKVIVLSSALIYGTGPARQPLVNEDYSAPRKHKQKISQTWSKFEALAIQYLKPPIRLLILRPVTVLPSRALLSRLLSRRFVLTLPGHNASLQLLSSDDLARAISCALSGTGSGIYNVAPDHAVPVHDAIRFASKCRIPIPRTMLRLGRRDETLNYLRYPWTISNQKIKKELGFVPGKTSLGALRNLRDPPKVHSIHEPAFDPFGMDKKYIDFYGKNLFRFLSDYYWRIETHGLEHVPSSGRGILVGMHRGFMPWDGVMTLHLLARKTGRYPRFLVHPGLLKFPFLANFMTKLGGVVACRETAAHILECDDLLGVFPEGIQGAFTPYRDAYKLQSFGRNAFVKMALQHRAPIIPFVTVGSAEIFPILGKIKSGFWEQYAEWPYIPVTPTFPLLPVPLPSKWHTLFLPPIHLEHTYPPEASLDRSIIKAIGDDIRKKMQVALDALLIRRRSIFRGSIFGREEGK